MHYFEGANQSHINAVIHTRQAYPPSKVSHLHIPFIVNGISVVSSIENSQFIEIELELNISCKCRLFLVEEFKMSKFKTSYYNYLSNQNSSSSSGITDTDQYVKKIYNSMYNSSTSIPGMVELLRPNIGPQKVKFTCRPLNNLYNVGIVIIPIIDSNTSSEGSNANIIKGFSNAGFSNSTYHPIGKSLHNYDIEEGDRGCGSIGDGILLFNYENSTNPLYTTKSSNSYNKTLNETLSYDTGIDFAVNIVRLDLATLGKLSSGELLLFSKKGGPIYSSMEIFGLKEHHSSAPSNCPNDVHSDLAVYAQMSARAQPARVSLTPEDCVICLTDHQQVLLLPCRHMCVCRSCLVKIDKCPVCRATFEEYMSLLPRSSNSRDDYGCKGAKDCTVKTSDIITL